MATIEENEIVEDIEKAISKAQSSKKDIPIALSKGKGYYRKAVSSIYYCGLWTTVSAGIIFFILTLFSTLFFIQGDAYYPPAYIIAYFLIQSLVCIIPVIIGYKIYSLKTTPNFMLFLLILSLAFNLLLTAGIIPLIALIFNVLALVRYSTYRNWFYNFNTK